MSRARPKVEPPRAPQRTPRVIARQGAGLLFVYLQAEERADFGAFSIGLMGAAATDQEAAALERCDLDALRGRLVALREAGVLIWTVAEPRGVDKLEGAA